MACEFCRASQRGDKQEEGATGENKAVRGSYVRSVCNHDLAFSNARFYFKVLSFHYFTI